MKLRPNEKVAYSGGEYTVYCDTKHHRRQTTDGHSQYEGKCTCDIYYKQDDTAIT